MLQGIALLDKPAGISSFQALRTLKQTAGKKTKVGHTGTLDPFATGLLVALVGPFTKLAQSSLKPSKTYRARIQLGAETDTLDSDGVVVRESPVPLHTHEYIIEVLRSRFLGRQQQTPPAFSAIHVNGKRAYELARNGHKVDLPSREIHIHDIYDIEPSDTSLELTVTCSSGTYIRSLGRDIAVALGTCGYLVSLRRLAVGEFAVTDAVVPDSVPREASVLSQFLRDSPWEYTQLTGNPSVRIHAQFLPVFLGGRPLHSGMFAMPLRDVGEYGVFTTDGTFAGQITLMHDGSLSYSFVSGALQRELT